MKQKHLLILKNSLSALLLLPVVAPIATADTITPDASGNVTINDPADGGAHNITTGYGWVPPIPEGYHNIFIGEGVILNPLGTDVIGIHVFDEIGASYSITNHGSIIGDAGNEGIDTIDQDGARPHIWVDNFGLISGAQGIRANNELILYNVGSVVGTHTDLSAVFAKNGAGIFNYPNGIISGERNGIGSERGWLEITNQGLIEGKTGDGIRTTGGVYLENERTEFSAGLVIGQESGIFADGPGGAMFEIYNDGLIQGLNAYGLHTTDTLYLENNLSEWGEGEVLGRGVGVVAGGDASEVVNYGTIRGETTTGVYFYGNDSVIHNAGYIFGGLYAVEVFGDNSYVSNGIDGVGGVMEAGEWALGLSGDDVTFFNPEGGQVLAYASGVESNGLRTQIINGGEIFGTISAGILFLTDDGQLENLSTGLIQGNHGVTIAGEGASITNHGEIFGIGAAGIGLDFRASNATVWNTGHIVGVRHAIQVEGDAGSIFELNNTGYLSAGDNAFRGGDGTDLLNFLGGSTVDGSIRTQGGNDVITLNARSGNVVINGSVDGGTGFDSLYLLGGQTRSGGSVNEINGAVQSMDLVQKREGGVAYINGSTQADRIEVSTNGGALYLRGDVRGNLNEKAEIVTEDGEIGGTGSWYANMELRSGIFSAGESPFHVLAPLDRSLAIGSVHVRGDVTHEAGSAIRHDFNSTNPMQTDLIQHSDGTYDLGSQATLLISPLNNSNVLRDGIYTVVDSSAPITGSLPQLAIMQNASLGDWIGPFLGNLISEEEIVPLNAALYQFIEVDLINGQSDLVFRMQRDYQSVGALIGGSEASLGAALDAAAGSPNPLMQSLISALDYSDLETVGQTLSSLSPGSLIGLGNTLISGNYRLHRITQDRLATAREQGEMTEAVARRDAKGQILSVTEQTVSSRGRLWGTFSYDSHEHDGNSRANYDGDTGSFTAGFDYWVAPDFLLGALLDGAKSEYGGLHSKAEAESFRFALYGTYGASTGFYSDFLLGYGAHDLEHRRTLGGVIGLAGTTLNTKTSADSLQALATAGYAMQAGQLRHGPFAGLEYQKLDVDGFSQGGVFPITVSDYDVSSLRLLLGYRVETKIDRFSPYASVAYAHEFEDKPISTTASLPGGSSFQIQHGSMESAILLGIGTGVEITPSLHAQIGYRGEISLGNGGLDSHGTSIGLSFSF